MMRIATFALALSLTGCGLSTGSVVRLVDGQEIDGRPVSETAYATYAYGALAEARGDLGLAERYYRAASEEDPESPEVWTRLGAVRCAQGLPSTDAVFARAADLDDEYAPLHQEIARCSLAKDPERALSEARRAVALDPASDASTELVIDALERLGRRDEARRWALARALVLPTPAGAWERVRALSSDAAQALADDALTERLERRRKVGLAAPCSALERDALDAALRADDLERAQSLAHACHLPAGRLATRAVALGAAGIGLRQAEQVLAADASNADAWVAALVARDLLHTSSTAAELEPPSAPPSPLASWLLVELIARRAGRDAARTWLGARGDLGAPQDALAKSVAERVKQTLAQ